MAHLLVLIVPTGAQWRAKRHLCCVWEAIVVNARGASLRDGGRSGRREVAAMRHGSGLTLCSARPFSTTEGIDGSEQ
eukprot:scaffold253315_cov35-Tisochrysis_lutea.AAC.8